MNRERVARMLAAPLALPDDSQRNPTQIAFRREVRQRETTDEASLSAAAYAGSFWRVPAPE
jgi:hypothetical protein